MRPSEALPRCARLITQPMAIIGQTSWLRNRLKVTNCPTVMAPRTTSSPPYHSTATNPSPTSAISVGWKAALQRISRTLRATYSWLWRLKSSTAAPSWA
jgi:hypothetical protein